MEPGEYEAMDRAEEVHFWYRSLRDEALSWTRRAARGREHPRVLDAGCGAGGMLKRIEGLAPKVSCVGLDLSDLALSRARAKTRAPLARGDVTRLPFRDGSFDAAVCLDVLYTREAYPRFAEALAGFRRVLRPGGLFILHLPAFESLRRAHDERVHTAHRFRMREVRAALSAAGFSPVRAWRRYHLLFPWAWVEARLRLGGGRRSSVEIPPRPVNAALSGWFCAERFLDRLLPLPFGLSIFAVGWAGHHPLQPLEGGRCPTP